MTHLHCWVSWDESVAYQGPEHLQLTHLPPVRHCSILCHSVPPNIIQWYPIHSNTIHRSSCRAISMSLTGVTSCERWAPSHSGTIALEPVGTKPLGRFSSSNTECGWSWHLFLQYTFIHFLYLSIFLCQTWLRPGKLQMQTLSIWHLRPAWRGVQMVEP